MSSVGFIDDWKEIVTNPSDFYKKMPTTGGYTDPLVFAAVNLAICVLFLSVFDPPIDILSGIIEIIISFIIFFGVTFAEITLLHIAYKRLGGTGSYEGTARFVLYATAVTIFMLVPFIGNIANIYQFYLFVVGGKFVHNLDARNSMMASSTIIAASIILVILYICFFKT